MEIALRYIPLATWPEGMGVQYVGIRMNLIAEDIHAALDADFEAVLGRAMTPVERAAKRGEREDIERRERWFQMANERKPWDGTVKYFP